MLLSLCTIVCSGQFYYSKVKKNTYDFDAIVDLINSKTLLEPIDSLVYSDGRVSVFDHKCLYASDKNENDPAITSFMLKYDLTRICSSSFNDQFFDTTISFHKDYAPFFGNAIVIFYDFGKSGYRDMTIHGKMRNDERVKIINDKYLYRVRTKPAFGE
jgi:hypothetical protein